LLFSTILPRELRGDSLPAVGFWASLAVADAVLNVCSITLALKWPNDLLLEGKKCAGVLSEGRSTGDVTRVVLGVGLNANRPKEVPAEIQSGAIWLSEHMGVPVDRTALLAAILTAYEERFDDLVERPTEVIARWSLRAALSGREVSVKASDGSILHAGKVLDVSSNGALVLQTKDGVVPVMLGDVDVLD
jgi:BirA family biotin operon repressor/biotin-[acetyl-CoA-carboxylase] ligase